MKHKGNALTFGMPATYRIQVQGSLDASWSSRMGGMAITCAGPEEEPEVTALVGPLADQAALLGVLNFLYDLCLPLLSVECLGFHEEPLSREEI
jgi:hypothetical protein